MTDAAKWPDDLQQRWPLPSAPRPIVVIGAGSIVRDAHLPIYRRLNFPVAGIFDVNVDAARERATAFGIPRVFASLDEAAQTPGAVFDVAIPPHAIAAVLERLTDGAAVLIQKPMGRDLAEARRILAIARAPPHCRDESPIAFRTQHAGAARRVIAAPARRPPRYRGAHQPAYAVGILGVLEGRAAPRNPDAFDSLPRS